MLKLFFSNPINFSLNFKTPHLTLFIPCCKNLGLERKDKMVCQGMNPPSSQITHHLNKPPIKIQSLSLLIGFGSDRQPKLQCLFRFHNHTTNSAPAPSQLSLSRISAQRCSTPDTPSVCSSERDFRKKVRDLKDLPFPDPGPSCVACLPRPILVGLPPSLPSRADS